VVGVDVQAVVDDAAADGAVVGASVAVLHDGVVRTGVTGVLNQRTGVEVTADSLFQIGSITKVWTATMILQHVEAGAIELDAPVTTYLPGWRLADPDATERVTVRHLLTHTSGMDGDHFLDTGRGDDCLEKYAASCATLGQTHAPGETLSYCNTGYSLLGRMLELLDGAVWDAVLRQRLLGPLGLRHTVTLPEEALLHRAAVGHIGRPGEDPKPTRLWTLQRAAGPAGLICSTATDVLTFAQLHLDGGTTANGERLLSAGSVAAMQEPQAEIPDPYALGAQHWGLGWFLMDWGGTRLYGHDGGTVGQSAQLRVLPDQGAAVCILMNGGRAPASFARRVLEAVVRPLAGVGPPPPPPPPEVTPDLDLDRFVGGYERLSCRLEVTRKDDDPGALMLTHTPTGELADLMRMPPNVYDLTPLAEDGRFLATMPGLPEPITATFYGDRDGVPRFVHFGGRASPRV
jgi:CubicO group peptidase (beta-lactamase class C family)